MQHRSRFVLLALNMLFIGPVLLGAALGGCGGAKPLSPQERINRLPIETADWRRVGYRWDWKVAPPLLVDETPLRTIAAPNTIVFQSSSGEITAFDAAGGQRLWSQRLANELTRFTGIVVDADRVVIASQAELFHLAAVTGQQLVRQDFEKLVNTAPVVQGTNAVVGSNSGELFAHSSISSGFKIWGHELPGQFEQDPVIVGNTVAGATTRGNIVFVDLATGRQTGQNRMFDGPGAPLAAGDGRLYVASLDQSLYAFDPEGARQVWRHRTPDPIRSAPAFHDGVVYCSFREAGLTALDAATGAVLWSNPDLRGRVVGVRDSRLLVFRDDGVAVVDRQRGSVLDAITIPNIVSVSTDSQVDGNLYLTSQDGVIARFVPAN